MAKTSATFGLANPDVGHQTPKHGRPTGPGIDVERELERRDDDAIMAARTKVVEIRSVTPTELDGVLPPRLSVDIRTPRST
jgi:hypothetical protein